MKFKWGDKMKFEDKPVVIKRSHLFTILVMIFNYNVLDLPGWLAFLPGIMIFMDICKEQPKQSQP